MPSNNNLQHFASFLKKDLPTSNIQATQETVWFVNNNHKKFVIPLLDLKECLRILSETDSSQVETLFNGNWKYEEQKYRDVFKELLGKLKSNAVVSILGSQTPNTVRCLELLAYFLLGEQPTPDLKNPDVLKPERLKKIFDLPDLKKEFSIWLEKTSKLTANSSNKYITALSGKLSKIGKTEIFRIHDLGIFNALSQEIEATEEYRKLNTNGNNMYSSAMKHYRSFLEERKTSESFPKVKLRIPKLFLLLAGISGTGKSRYVKEQAKASSGHGDHQTDSPNYCLVPVRPDWHEPSDLLGYVSRIGGAPKFVATDFLRFCAKAWLNATHNDGTPKDPSQMTPYWLCLDEMNLAPVEQYFADYLSVIETREWKNGDYSCAPLLRPSMFKKDLNEAALTALFQDLFDTDESPGNDSQSDKLWEKFIEEGMPVPPNLIVAGTVNMDETTHGFSRKVIDRALTLDFQEFFPNDFDKLLSGDQIPHRTLTFPVCSQADADLLSGCSIDPNGEKTKEFAKSLNKVLKGTPFELAYRALNELYLSVACFSDIAESAEDSSATTETPGNALTGTELEQAGNEGTTPQESDRVAPQETGEPQALPIRLQAIWDDFLMQKVLPRIEGDAAKLKATSSVNEIAELSPSDYGKGSLLHQLYNLLKEDEWLGKIWQGELDPDTDEEKGTRPDLLRDTTEKVPCRSRAKLEWMMQRLKANHFTDFWC